MTPASTTPEAVRDALRDREEVALIDVRPEAVFAQGHPLFAASFPLATLELDTWARLPRRDVPIVLYDGGMGLLERAVERLARIGYSRLSTLAGDLDGWAISGGELFEDVNSPSKAFGELVESRRHTPSLPAEEVAQLLANPTAKVVVLDARRFDEFATMSIPRGSSAPGGELVARFDAAVPSVEELVIVNCAGRTRSIIGAQSLINAGVPNKVVALRNGTIGWTLAGLTLEHGASRRVPIPDEARDQARGERVRALARRAGVEHLPLDAVTALDPDGTRTIYRFDVRAPEEYAITHRPDFRNAPGGQLVQETDWFAPVRGALIVLTDMTDGVRADMTGSWLAQMGWQVVVTLDAEVAAEPSDAGWVDPTPKPPAVTIRSVNDVARLVSESHTVVFDVSPSRTYRTGHLPGSWWVRGDDLPGALTTLPSPAPDRVVLVSDDDLVARFVAPDLLGAGVIVEVLSGGTHAWVAAGLPLEAGATRMLSEPLDRYVRPYEGTSVDPATMQAYLDWEYGLVAQLERDGTHHFNVV